MKTYNKGEWSEFYVLTSLITTGELHQSDINLVKDKKNVYEIVKAYKNENGYDLEFHRKDKILVHKVEDNLKSPIGSFDISYFEELSRLLLTGIKNGKGKSFAIESINSHLESLQINKLKADSGQKADLNLRIYDHRLAKETDLGFSIKSLLGGDSTLFNTGAGNNFIYDVLNFPNEDLDTFNKRTYKPAGGVSKLTYRLKELLGLGCKLEFDTTQSKQLWRNLKMVDGDLPEILSEALLTRWINRKRSLKDVSDLLETTDPLNYYNGEKSEQKLYEYKLKKFLTESAMGMTSETPWLGEYDSFGGVIIAKTDGDIVCFHIYDFNLFRNYLLNNTVFEQASTSEDAERPGYSKPKPKKKYFYGWLEKSAEKNIIKLNLQIRFK